MAHSLILPHSKKSLTACNLVHGVLGLTTCHGQSLHLAVPKCRFCCADYSTSSLGWDSQFSGTRTAVRFVCNRCNEKEQLAIQLEARLTMIGNHFSL